MFGGRISSVRQVMIEAAEESLNVLDDAFGVHERGCRFEASLNANQLTSFNFEQ